MCRDTGIDLKCRKERKGYLFAWGVDNKHQSFQLGLVAPLRQKDLPEIGFEKASHTQFDMNYTRNRIATPRMVRIVPATACPPTFSLNTK